jgi:hypothetical protein
MIYWWPVSSEEWERLNYPERFKDEKKNDQNS